MSGLLEYIVSEFKSKKLSKRRAAAFVRELKAKNGGSGGEPLHPLVGANISDLSRQAYASRFTGQEFFLADHRIRMGGDAIHSVLPGAAYLEMARAAYADALRNPERQGRLELQDVIWSQPLVADDGAEVEIELTPDAEGVLTFQIVSTPKQTSTSREKIVHCQGSGALLECDAPVKTELPGLKAQMVLEELDASTVYETYRRLGILYGPGHQSVRRIFRGKDQVLAELRLPDGLEESLSALSMHPSLVDGAFQASIGLMADLQGIGASPPVPFALSSARIFAPCPSRMFAWIRHSAEGGTEQGDLRLDLDLMDSDGNLCVQMQGFWSKVLRNGEPSPAPQSTQALLAAPVWRPADLLEDIPPDADDAEKTRPYPAVGLIWCGEGEPHRAGLSEAFSETPVTMITMKQGDGPAERFQRIATALFGWIRDRQSADRSPSGIVKGLVQVVVGEETEIPAAAGISGMLRSWEWEQPGMRGQIILVDPIVAAENVWAEILRCRERPDERMIRIGVSGTSVMRWEEVPVTRMSQTIGLKESGVYLITGGLGGLGRIFAREIQRQAPNAKIYLTGRGELDAPKRELLAALQSFPGGVEYRRMDLGNLEQVQGVLSEIRATNRGLNGIIHSAGMTRDGILSDKTQEDFLSVLEPKVAGTCHLDQASRDFDLDFMVLFSSLASAYGNAGQADYAMANGFLDGFAEHRNQWVLQGKRKGKTLSINWPLWLEGGMQMDESRIAIMRSALGIEPLPSDVGVELFHRCLELPGSRVQVQYGNLKALRRLLQPAGEPTAASAHGNPTHHNPPQPNSAAPEKAVKADDRPNGPVQEIAERTLDFLKREICSELKVPLHQLDPVAGLDRYGINSIVAMNLTARLEKTFGPLSKTLLFEQQTVRDLRDHFLSSHREVLERLFAQPAQPVSYLSPIAAKESTSPVSDPDRNMAAKTQSAPHNRLSNPSRLAPHHTRTSSSRNEPIAIIGLSGRYPGAPDVAQYWRNLRVGKDCITEVPRQRWDWREFYSEDRTKAGFHNSKWGGFIEGVDEFDPLFFGITPWEAEHMDPQERLFLQHAWMALEDAGYTRADLQIPRTESQPGQVGVYAGVMYGEYNPSGSVASIANRVAYTMNLHGPCMTLDTMCSSSLTAIHLAGQDLKLGRTDLGIAGGVNITIHPGKYGMLSMGQFISSDGHCQSFGEGGNGYIPGEGVGVVLLKRLSDAIRDKDNIYAVVRGSALNHGGKTNGFTVPNPQAQADAILQAMRSAGTEVRRISYIEAHGTGTKLGDPIEIAALTKAFRASTRETGFCRIGSAKSNIGHCESAAGIAGLTKVLLQMRYGEIVPSLHSQRLNPDIDFGETPFVVNQTLIPWERAIENGRALPRIAGLSSFGAGGSNAHFIIEEYLPPIEQGWMPVSPETQGEVLIPLSARTRGQLRQKAADLLRFLTRPLAAESAGEAAHQEWAASELGRMAYTLQIGREHMSCRLGLLATSVGQLTEKLQAYLHEEMPVEGLFEGTAEENRNALALFQVDGDLQNAIERWIDGKKHSHLLDLWTKGLDFDWRKLHRGVAMQRMSLPAYPFARDRYWKDEKESTSAETVLAKVGILHPLVHANRSDFTRQQYQSTFSGNEWLIKDHRVGPASGQTRRIMPAVAYLEMARAAMSDATPGAAGFQPMEIRGVVWAKPLELEQERTIATRLDPLDDQESEFRILGVAAASDDFHCQGRIRLLPKDSAPPLPWAEIRSRFSGETLLPAELYRVFQDMGVQYGPGFRSVNRLVQNGREVLAEVGIPPGVAAETEGYGLHPALLDGALQAVLGLFQNSPSLSRKLFLPFSLESMRMFAPCNSGMTAWVRPQNDGEGEVESEIRKFDIDIVDAQGMLCVELRGFCARAVSSLSNAAESVGETLRAIPEWKTLPTVISDPTAGVKAFSHVILCELPGLAEKFLRQNPEISDVLVLADADGSVAERYERHALACFGYLRKILQAAPGEAIALQLLVPDSSEGRLFSGIYGLLRSACLENPSLKIKVAMVDPAIGPQAFGKIRENLAAAPDGCLARFDGDAMQVLGWKEISETLPAFESASYSASTSSFKSGGVYLITGGLGGLGILFAREILRNTRDATIILTGRGAPTRAKLDALSAIGAASGKILYEKVDLENFDDVTALFARIMQTQQRLDGIIHSAGMIKDGLLLRKPEAEFLRVLKPKVTGTYHLDQASRELELDFFVLFSSVAGALGNLGQCDYAAANAFMDRFCLHRNELRDQKMRKGQTVSINWPLWQGGGMHVDPAMLEWMRRQTGLVPLREEAGVLAFRECLAKGWGHALILQGEAGKLRRLLAEQPPEAPVTAPTAAVTSGVTPTLPWEERQTGQTSGGPGILDAMQDFLKGEFSRMLKIPQHELDVKAQFDNVGIDSILAVNLTNKLEETFGPLPKTLLFEHQTLAALARHFARKYPEALKEKVVAPQQGNSPANPSPMRNASEPPAIDRAAGIRFLPNRNGRNNRDRDHDRDIAIIGVSGMYPQAENLEEFWTNLREGRDCITEIPIERWDYRKHFHAEKNRPGKSYGKWGGFLKEVDKFDPLFFHISPKEAELIDPQERLFLETVWQSIEDAGYSKESFSKQRVGVYVGAMWGQYQLFGAEAVLKGLPIVTSSSHASIANRVSYFFDFRGPSLAIDTMCSSSLTAIHLACEELRRGGIEAAVAGGVNVSIHPNKYLNLSQGNFISSDGRCRSFGSGGDGYVPGEGVGAVLLKSLQQALRDGDQIYAVIKSGALNHGGKTHGYTVPNPQAQGDLIGEALHSADMNARTLDYLEAHGTGTALGDPIEITGLADAFSRHTNDKGFCPIGSVKSNIGHLESAAGIAALTKVLLQLKHNELVPSLHAEQENPNIDFSDTPFYVQRQLADWPRRGSRPRRIGISSFGAGGSNAHLIVEEFIPSGSVGPGQVSNVPVTSAESNLFVFSAKDPAALSRYAGRYSAFLERNPGIPPKDLAYTLQTGRTEMVCRLAIVANGIAELRDKISRWGEMQVDGKPTASDSKAMALENVFYGRGEKHGFPVGELLEGEAGKAILKELLAERNLQKIARVWTSGVAIEWTGLPGERGRRISLPTYPFARERCWIEIPDAHSFGATVTEALPIPEANPIPSARPFPAVNVEETPELRHFALTSLHADLITRSSGQSIQGPLILLGGTGFMRDALVAELRVRASPQNICWVRFGPGFTDQGPEGFIVRPGSREDFAQVADTLAMRHQSPTAILHFPGEECSATDCSRVESDLQLGIFSLAWLCQGLMRSKHMAPLRILALSTNQGLEGDPLHQGLSGFFKSLHQENPKYSGKAVEVLTLQLRSDEAKLVGILLSELEEQDWSADGVRYVETKQNRFTRLVNRLGEIALKGGPPSSLPLRQGGVYLVSGGLGGLGFLISKHVQQTLDGRMVLFGRSPFAGAAEQKFSELRARSEHVHYMQADVSRLEDMQEVVREAKRRFGRIDGVIHSAGIHRDAFLLAKDPDAMAQVIRPKVLGCLNLDEATKDEDLDIFALFSSAVGLLGNVGQCDYAFGNRFLDSFAMHRESLRGEGKRCGKTFAISWPYWQDGGMVLSQQEIDLNKKVAGIVPLPTHTGIECWEQILRGEHSRVMPLYGLPRRMDANLLRLGANPPESRLPAPQIQGEKSDRGDKDKQDWLGPTIAYLQNLIAQQTKIAKDRLDPRERFEDFGIDSVMVGGINAILEQDLGALPKTLFYEYATIEELAEYLVRETGTSLRKLFGAVAASPQPPASDPTAMLRTGPQPDVSPEEDRSADLVAVIGIHARFPQAEDLEQFWSNLEAGHDAVEPVPSDRWDYRKFFDADPGKAAEGKIYCKWGAFLENAGQFDPEFFGISEQEANIIDPQERLALQSVWSALEDAGYTRETLRKLYPKGNKGRSASVGVFYGVTTNSYQLLGPEQWASGNAIHPNSMPWSIANRISYFFDFQGPSLPVDSACSSASVAIHLACESLKRNDCRIAVAGGVNLYLHPSKYQSFCQRGMISRTGKTCSFGAGDEGFVPGEGVGSLILKPLSQAIADNDTIHAVIRGSAYDHAGRSNGYSAPNPRSQADLIERTLESAGVRAETIGYVEGHGTGTQLGDSVEIAALNQAFRRHTDRQKFCAVGSVKANVGHAESAAGIAAAAKVLLQLRHRKLAPSLHSQEINPNIDLNRSPFYLQHGLSAWEAPDSLPRRALINSFGAGGVNACLVLEEYLPRKSESVEAAAAPYLFVLSAKSQSNLEEYVRKMIGYLDKFPGLQPARIAYTSQRGREPMPFRLAIVFDGNQELLQSLRDWKSGAKPKGGYAGTAVPGSSRETGVGQSDTDQREEIMKSQDLHAIAGQWVRGVEIAWETLYPGKIPGKVSLPTYPFAGKRYWISPSPAEPFSQRESSSDRTHIHPLVAYNSSTLEEIKLTSLLSDREFYAREHSVNGIPIFPGSGFAELACVGGNLAGGRKVLAISDLIWMKPLAFQGGPQLVETHLQASGSDGAAFQIVSYDEERERVVHCEGNLKFASSDDPIASGEIQSILDLRAKAKTRLGGDELYRNFEIAGLGYGPAFRTIQEIHRGDGFSLARLEIPDPLLAGFFDFILHPSILDGAFQTVAGFQEENASGRRAYLPFAIDAIEILGPLAPICFSYAEQVATTEPAKQGSQSDSPVKKFHITLMGEGGNVFARIRNFYARAMDLAVAR